MSVGKNKIILRDSSHLKEFKNIIALLYAYQHSNQHLNCYMGYQYYDADYYFDNLYDDVDCDYSYEYSKNAFGDEIKTCIPAGKEYIRNKKIDEIFGCEENTPSNSIHIQLLELSLLS